MLCGNDSDGPIALIKKICHDFILPKAFIAHCSFNTHTGRWLPTYHQCILIFLSKFS